MRLSRTILDTCSPCKLEPFILGQFYFEKPRIVSLVNSSLKLVFCTFHMNTSPPQKKDWEKSRQHSGPFLDKGQPLEEGLICKDVV